MDKKCFVRCACLALSVFICARAAYPAIFNIANGDVIGLKAAIIAANTNGANDTINLAPNGVYTLNGIDNSVNGSNGLPEIRNDVLGLDLTINGNGATIQRSSAPGTPEFRILHVSSISSLSCVGLTIANGKLSGNSMPVSSGGGICISQAHLTLTSCTLHNNTATFGGALFNSEGSLGIDACTIGANTGGNGAGIYSTGVAVITNADITENIAPGGASGGGIENYGELTLADSRVNLNAADTGAGIHSNGSTTLQRCVVNDNTASFAGGGVHNLGGTLTIESSTLHGNKASVEGGAILNEAAAILQNSTVSNNSAPNGGGFFNSDGALTLLSCTVSGNKATQLGGALHNSGGSVQIRCATFAFNSATGGGSCIYNTSPGPISAQVTLRNTILQSGTSGLNLFNTSGAIISEGHNISDDPAGGNAGTGPGGHLNQPSDVRNTNSNLGPLQNNGGPTLTHALLPLSPAIDAGDDAVLGLPLSLTSDQRGPGFLRRRGTHVDMGAVETGVTLIVTTIDDHDDGNCTPADCTLREAIAATNAASSADVSFAPGVTGTIQLNNALPDVSANLLLQGPGPNLLEVRRNAGGNYRILTISNGTNNGPSVSILGLTISNGQASSGTFPTSSGGGILNDYGRLQLTNCTVAGNSSDLAGLTYGGGIFNNGGNLFVTASTIADNKSSYGGGIASYRTVAGLSDVYLSGNTISGNSCPGGGLGGGIYNEAINAGSVAQLSLVNCTVSGNDVASSLSGDAGGALFTSGKLSGSSQVSVSDCTLSGNNADAAGGIYNSNFSASAFLTIYNTILQTGTRGENIINSSGTFTSLGHNLCDDFAGDATNSGTGPAGYLNAPSDIRNTDPLLGPLQDNGGLTFTHALLTGSAAINAGQDTIDSEIDQRGFLRLGANDIGAFELDGETPSIPILNAVSRKTHGTVGSFDINLPQSGPLGIECRSGGAGGNHQVIVTFANPVSVGGVSVSSVNGLANATRSVSTNVVTINLSGVANAQTLMITLSNVNNGETIGNVVLRMGVLFGDSTGNGAVTSSDISQIKLASGQPVTGARFRNDLNLSGSINASDISAAKLSSGTALSQAVEP